MNYRRGFQRVYVVVSIVWFLATIPILWMKWTKSIDAVTRAEGNLASVALQESKLPPPPPGYKLDLSPDRFVAEESIKDAKAQRPIALTLAIFLAPAFLYAAGVALFWVVRGFRSG